MRESLVERIPEPWRPGLRRGWHVLMLRGSRSVIERRMRLRARRTDTLSGLLHRKMLHDRRPLLTTVADKWAARAYIEECLGPGYLPTVLASAEIPGDIVWDSMPREYVVKVNHGSGGIVMVSDDADPGCRLPSLDAPARWSVHRVRPKHADPSRITTLLRHWLTVDYAWMLGHRSIEWCYRDIPRRIVVEELLRDSEGLPPREYRLFVIGGKVRFLQVEVIEAGVACTGVMSPDWEGIPARFLNPLPIDEPSKPAALAEMLHIAEALARPIGDFLRVDLYDLGSRIVAGELTNYPYGGSLPVRPRSYDKAWAAHWPRTLAQGRAGVRGESP